MYKSSSGKINQTISYPYTHRTWRHQYNVEAKESAKWNECSCSLFNVADNTPTYTTKQQLHFYWTTIYNKINAQNLITTNSCIIMNISIIVYTYINGLTLRHLMLYLLHTMWCYGVVGYWKQCFIIFKIFNQITIE